LKKYIFYLIKHKWFAMIECFKVGLIFRGIFHDTSKFFPDEFFPYAHHFYNGIKTGRNKSGYYKPTNTGDKAFDYAWFLHTKRNNHHWQYWVVPEETGTFIPIEMNYKSIKEMICDWKAAGRAQHSKLTTLEWYKINKNNLVLNKNTRKILEEILTKTI